MTGTPRGAERADASAGTSDEPLVWRRVLRRTASGLASNAAPWSYALALVLWASSWNLRFSVLMRWLPLEPVWIATGLLALCLAHRFGRPLRVPPAVLAPLLLLVLGFLPGALNAAPDGYGPAKVAAMVFVLGPVVLTALVLLDTPEARRAWMWAQLLIGLAVAAAAALSHDVDLRQPGRFSLATVDTVSTARLVGVAMVVLLLIGLTSLPNAWWAFPLAGVDGMVLVHVGSRGPLTFVLLSVVLVVLLGRWYAGRRVERVPVLVLAGMAVYAYALVGGGAGGQRIVDSLRSGLSDQARQELRDSAIDLGLKHPFGIGWGDFAAQSDIGHILANAQGVAYAHNAFAEAFAEGGLLAVVTLGVVVVVAVARLWRVSDERAGAIVLGTTLYWLLNAQVSLDLVGNRFMWLSLAAGLAAYTRPLRRVPVSDTRPPLVFSRKMASKTTFHEMS